MLKEFRRLKNNSDWFIMVKTHRNASKHVETHRNASKRAETRQDGSGLVQTSPNMSLIQLNLTHKYYIQSPLPLPATLFQRPLDNF